MLACPANYCDPVEPIGILFGNRLHDDIEEDLFRTHNSLREELARSITG